MRRASCSFSPLNSCFHTLSGLLGSDPEQLALCLSSPEAALPTQCLGPLCSSSPPEPSQAAAQNTELSTEGAAIEELETHVPIHYLSQGDASLSEIGRNS